MIDGQIVNAKAIHIVSYVIFSILSALFLWGLILFCKYMFVDRRKFFLERNKYIRWNSGYVGVGFAGSVLFWLLLLWLIFDPTGDFKSLGTPEENMVLAMAFSLIDLMTLFLLICPLNWRIQVESDYCIYTNTFGIKHKFKYDELELQPFRAVYKGYAGGLWRFSVSYRQENSAVLVAAWQSYLKSHQETEQADSTEIFDV